MLLDDAIRQRRSHKVFTGAPVADATIAELLELAVWAPNHKYTEPWRFSVVRGPRLADLAMRVHALPNGKGLKLHDILRQAGAVVLISYAPSADDPVRDPAFVKAVTDAYGALLGTRGERTNRG